VVDGVSAVGAVFGLSYAATHASRPGACILASNRSSAALSPPRKAGTTLLDSAATSAGPHTDSTSARAVSRGHGSARGDDGTSISAAPTSSPCTPGEG